MRRERRRNLCRDARVTVVLDSEGVPVEKFTDSSGNVSVNLGDAKPNAHGRLYVRAEGYQPLEKYFVVANSMAERGTSARTGAKPRPRPLPKAGLNRDRGARVVNSYTNAGREPRERQSWPAGLKTDLTDDKRQLPDFAFALHSRARGVRLQVKKAECFSA